ncbi:MAG TPA: SusD/RagB family nutrient-binding outer membrane lipoprotein [Chitinophagaceae bacterium]
MKYSNKLFAGIALSAMLLVSCTKNFEELNTDPNSVPASNYPPVYNLTKSQLEYTGNNDFSYETWRVNIIYCGMMMQQLANTSWYAGDKYMQNDAWANSYFEVSYRDQVKYVVDLLKITKDNPKYANLYQIGRIMKVMIFHRITDIYGDAPYTEAGLGYYDRIFAPKYDQQSAIYADMLKELEEAGAALDPAKDKPGTGDLIFRGETNSITLWKKLAYSMMLRLGMRLTKIDLNAAKTWVEKAFTGGVMTSNADNAYILHDASGGRNTVNRNSNILAGEWNATGTGEVFLSKTFIDFLKSNNDPRLGIFSKVKSSGSSLPADQLGLPNGYDQNGGATDISHAPNYPGTINNYSTIRADVFLKLNGATFLVTYAQTELLLAEAAKRGWSVGGTADDHYKKGVTAAMKQLQQYDANGAIADADILTYLAAHPYVDANGYALINTQYWVASFLDWYETWANWRRSAFPALVPVNYIGNATGGQIPRRMLYPASESSANGTNYQDAITRQGANSFLTRVWWDKQ